MSDTTTTSEHDDLSTTQEYTIAGIVILFFGLLYWLFNYGFPDIKLNSGGTQSAIVAAGNQTGTQNQFGADPANNKQQFVTRPANSDDNGGVSATDTPQLAQDDTALTEASAHAAKQAATEQSAEQSTENFTSAATHAETAGSSSSSATNGTATNGITTQNATATDASNTNAQHSTQQQTRTGAITATASSLAQRVITDPAVLKLRDHLFNNALEKPVLMNSMSFADKSNQVELSADTQVLDLAALMQQNPDIKMLIRGHTANEGSEAANKTLSLARATALGRQLVEVGATPGNIIIMGMGNAEPLSGNNNQQNRGKNRRIDVAITQ